MKKPALIINNKTYEPRELKARIWRKILEFDESKKDLLSVDFIDKHAEIISMIFPVSTDDILDNLNLEDILKVYNDCLTYILQLIGSKLEIANKEEKNA